MLQDILKNQLGTLLDKDIPPLNKALKLTTFALCIFTAIQLKEHALRIINLVFPSLTLISKEEQSSLLDIATFVLAAAGYYYLVDVSISLRSYADRTLAGFQGLFITCFKVSFTPEILKIARRSKDVVMHYEVQQYLETNDDSRVREKLEIHDKIVKNIYNRKTDAMTTSILLCINYYINYETLSNYARPYWLTIIFLVIWSAHIPLDTMFLRIRNNKIRSDEPEII